MHPSSLHFNWGDGTLFIIWGKSSTRIGKGCCITSTGQDSLYPSMPTQNELKFHIF